MGATSERQRQHRGHAQQHDARSERRRVVRVERRLVHGDVARGGLRGGARASRSARAPGRTRRRTPLVARWPAARRRPSARRTSLARLLDGGRPRPDLPLEPLLERGPLGCAPPRASPAPRPRASSPPRSRLLRARRSTSAACAASAWRDSRSRVHAATRRRRRRVVSIIVAAARVRRTVRPGPATVSARAAGPRRSSGFDPPATRRAPPARRPASRARRASACERSNARARSTICATCARHPGRHGRRATAPASSRCGSAAPDCDGASCTWRPLSSVNIVAPTAQRSVRPSTSSQRASACSGAMKAGVPITIPARVPCVCRVAAAARTPWRSRSRAP